MFLKYRKITKLLIFVLMVSCGDTNLGRGLSLPSGGGGDVGGTPTPVFSPGTDLNFTETSQADFQAGSLNQVSAGAAGNVEIARNYIGETGRVDIANEISSIPVRPITFRNTYTNPIVVAYIATRANTESIDARVTNVTSTGFDLFIEDPDGDGIGATETVIYMVVEQGRHDFASGLSLEADLHATTTEHISGNPFAGDVVTFSSAFGVAPVMLHSLNSYNNTDFKASVCDSFSTTQFTIAQETAQTGTATVSEDIGWIAITPGAGTLIDVSFDVGTETDGVNHGVDDGPETLSYGPFAAAPDIIVKGCSGGGIDGYWMRGAGTWNTTTHTAHAEEDQVGDAERAHAGETFTYGAFDPDSNIGVYFASGTRTSSEINLSSVNLVASSQINFNTTTPAGTTVLVETNLSLDGGSTYAGWQPATSGTAISGLEDNVDVSQGRLQYRVTLTTTDETVTPSLDDITISVTARTTDQ